MNEFFALTDRLRLIRRWSLMRCTQPENDAEHSLQTAMLAHAIALIGVHRFSRTYNPEHIMALAVYHDASEVLTGDLPTPVKYHSEGLREAYRRVEEQAQTRLLAMLPEDLRADYAPLIRGSEDAASARVVKAADRISAYLKCLKELRAGNREFEAAGRSTLESIRAMALPEADAFMAEFVPAFSLTLDEINPPQP